MASRTGSCRRSPTFVLATCAHKHWYLFRYKQQLGGVLVQDMRFFDHIGVLYYSYVARKPFCTEEFKTFFRQPVVFVLSFFDHIWFLYYSYVAKKAFCTEELKTFF